ncbi:MAG: HAD family phosphatase [Lachnospiraceae bacterium]|nr:HAD family phosphatase [Lachnospiraceae bacterium]
MNIKLIATDLDGTLLRTDKSLSRRNIEALRQASERGVEIVISTGRPWIGISDIVRDMPFIRYAIIINGAMVWDSRCQKAIYQSSFSTEQALEIWDFVQKYNTMTDVHIGGVGRISPYYMEHVSDYVLSESIAKLVKKTRIVTDDVREAIRSSKNGAQKINLTFMNIEEKNRALEELKRFDFAVAVSSVANNIEINHVSATKGRALMGLAGHLGIDISQVMAFGDSGNDLSMIKLAGVGVAMGNADEEIKAAADIITLDNDSDGVCCAVDKFVLGSDDEGAEDEY